MKDRPCDLFEKLYADIDGRSLRTPIEEVSVQGNVRLFVKREDLIHPEIPGNKYWKLFYNVRDHLAAEASGPILITFGGAYSNHIAAVAALGREIGAETIGVIRGDELRDKWRSNPTLVKAAKIGMTFRFVSREEYREKNKLSAKLKEEFPAALIIPEGGTNELAVKGVKFMLDDRTREFGYLCCAVGTGGTVAGLARSAGPDQKVLGFKVVRDDSLEETVDMLSGGRNAVLIDASYGGYGKFDKQHTEVVGYISERFGIPLEPVYTGKMFRKLLDMIEAGYFTPGAKILAFQTGGLQAFAGIEEKGEGNL